MCVDTGAQIYTIYNVDATEINISDPPISYLLLDHQIQATQHTCSTIANETHVVSTHIQRKSKSSTHSCFHYMLLLGLRSGSFAVIPRGMSEGGTTEEEIGSLEVVGGGGG